ncbi:MAG: diguanylate cyclase response regulator [Desulfuromonas sp.]|uniref:diguanylate cyclase n=1 Tax=Desulfuromonas sp. TaxID=892 RepID=UPI000CB9836F|nr:diguanylate cyclase [Desulfuromonas sp.]PLX84178.1 MAG: diguanylate cyclase response regulator [Desulfuromonas sp.]
MKSTILIIDDSRVARRAIMEAFRESALFSVYLEASSGREGLLLLGDRAVDVVLCDLEMQDMDGWKVLQRMQARAEWQDIPVILLTGHQEQEEKVLGLERGASDFIFKPFDPEELVARVKVQLKVKTLQDNLKKNNRLLLELSNTDPLTGLCNRRCLMQILDKELERSERSKIPLSLAMVDIDFFKRVNDTYGHQLGDTVLIAVAELLKGHLRQYDVAARFGGEEFALVFPDTLPDQALQVAERIRAAAMDLSFPGPLQEVRLSLSLGISAFPHQRVRSVEGLIREADRALYGAKRGGRNRVKLMPGL